MLGKGSIEDQNKCGCLINWDELRDLEGKLLTYIDATFIDKEQREAQKSLVRNLIREWYRHHESNSFFGTLSVDMTSSTDQNGNVIYHYNASDYNVDYPVSDGTYNN